MKKIGLSFVFLLVFSGVASAEYYNWHDFEKLDSPYGNEAQLTIYYNDYLNFSIPVSYDSSITAEYPDSQASDSYSVYVGDNTGTRNYQAIFSFDVSSFTSMFTEMPSIDSMTFSAYQTYSDPRNGDGLISIAMGNSGNYSSATWNTSHDDFGNTLDSKYTDMYDTGTYISWDVTSVGAASLFDDNFVAFFLFIDPEEILGPPPREQPIYQESDDYGRMYTHPVPEPATMLLLGISLAGLIGFGRKRFGKS